LKPATLTEAAPQSLRGVPRVLDTGTLLLNGTTVRLSGVEGEAGQPVSDLARYISGREVACEPVERNGGQYRCKLGEYDLGEAVVLNGAGRAAANAPERLREAEEKARGAGRGIWQQ
jgi:endonuclease YncB( thermonuclease family)